MAFVVFEGGERRMWSGGGKEVDVFVVAGESNLGPVVDGTLNCTFDCIEE